MNRCYKSVNDGLIAFILWDIVRSLVQSMPFSPLKAVEKYQNSLKSRTKLF